MFFKTSGIHGLRRMSYPLSQFCYFQALRQVLLLDEIPEKFNGKAILMECIKRIPKPSTFLKISELFQGLKWGLTTAYAPKYSNVKERGSREVETNRKNIYIHLQFQFLLVHKHFSLICQSYLQSRTYDAFIRLIA